MKIICFVTVSILLFFSNALIAQNSGVLVGNVKDKNLQINIENATISVVGKSIGTITDKEGNFRLELPVGTYNISVSTIGYEEFTKYNITISSGNPETINFELQQATATLKEVVITSNKNRSAVTTDMITPLSVQQLTNVEIRSNPGGNFDVSKVIQTLPGVGSSSNGAARNDVIIRGGAPNENVYYLDGVEIPVLNHFQTQGSSGGAQGILNVAFIDELKLSSSAFDAKYDNALASTFVIKQKNGNTERISGNVRASLTESILTLDGPINKKTTFLFSARKSYLDLLFKALDFPIRPNFYDSQFKITKKINEKTTLSFIGIGAIDNFEFASIKDATPEKLYVTRSQPYINQWTYTTGVSLKKKIDNGFINFVLSRNVFNTALDKFEDEQKIESQRTLKLRSSETENKFRIDYNKYINGWKYSFGIAAQYVSYSTDLFNKTTNEIKDSNGNIITPAQIVNFDSDINFFKYGLFAQVAKNVLNDKLLFSAGVRTDGNSFMKEGGNPLRTISPRLSVSYKIAPLWDLTGSIGSYFKIPTYTTLGFKDENNDFINKSMKYIQSTHYVLGTQFLPNNSLRVTFETFFKKYNNYPVSENTGISLANQGTDFGSIGSEKIASNGKGETYGFEVFVQQKLIEKLFYVISYTYVRSKFSGNDGRLIASSWDSQHIISSTLGYKFNTKWEAGLKYRFSGGTPYTPFDPLISQQNYLLLGQGTIDYNQLNSKRLLAFNQLDFRIDKKINYKKTALNLYIDIQNILAFKNQSKPDYTFKRNSNNTDFLTTDGQPINQNGSNAIPILLDNKERSVIPNFGLIFEF